jgi:hypothetical protein
MTQILKELFTTYGGVSIVFIALSFAAIWFIRATKTTRDDEILDKFVVTGIDYALKLVPANSTLNWVKFTANALGKFMEVYTKTQGQPADAKIYEKAKLLIETIASQKEVESLSAGVQKN